MRTGSCGASESVAPIDRAPPAAPALCPARATPPPTAECLLEGVPVLKGHEVVEDGVDGGGEVVEEPGDVVEVLVDGAEDRGLLEVDIGEALGVEGGPAEEEGHDHGSCKSRRGK